MRITCIWNIHSIEAMCICRGIYCKCEIYLHVISLSWYGYQRNTAGGIQQETAVKHTLSVYVDLNILNGMHYVELSISCWVIVRLCCVVYDCTLISIVAVKNYYMMMKTLWVLTNNHIQIFVYAYMGIRLGDLLRPNALPKYTTKFWQKAREDRGTILSNGYLNLS